MADIEKRLKYYNGQFLQERDFTAEQEYHLDRLRRHNRQHHHPGIADGLEVTAAVGATSASISPGTAIDAEGRQIVLPQPHNVAFAANLHGQWALVVISYDQEESDDATVGDAGKTRWLERPDVDVILEAGAPRADIRIRLARLRIAANGTIAEVDATVRTPAGARLRPEETVERLRLSRPGVSANLWPVLSSGAASRADLAGDLSVTGNILVTGNVDGRDVSADGAKLDNLALSKIGGVSNPGADIALVGQTGITINGNDATNQITFAGAAPATIAGISNPGGNIAVNGSGGISVTTGGNAVNISTSPAAIGAFPAGDYLKRSNTYILLNNGDGNGAVRTITCNFEPKFIWATATMNAILGGNWHAFTSSGYCKVDNTSSWTHYCTRCFLTRTTGAPYLIGHSWADQNGIAAASFTDNTQNPVANNVLTLRVTQVTATGFVVTLDRTSNTGRDVSMFIDLQLAILG